jgi:hypothetical protein
MRSKLAWFVIPIVLMLASSACGSGPGVPANDAQTVPGPATPMATNTPGSPATATSTTAPEPTSAQAVPFKPLAGVSRGPWWEVNCKASTLTLWWKDNSKNEAGFRVYRDGEVIADLPADYLGFTDSISAGTSKVLYEIRAYNEIGESAGLTTTAEYTC